MFTPVQIAAAHAAQNRDDTALVKAATRLSPRAAWDTAAELATFDTPAARNLWTTVRLVHFLTRRTS